jgi:UDP-galactopyranose mutase
MIALIDQARRKQDRRQVNTLAPSRPTLRQRAVVIGAGPTGLSAAYHLGEQSLLLEQNDSVGGWCRSVSEGGFTFDYAGHIMFSNDPYVHEMYGMLLGDNVHWQDREAWIYSKRVYTRYPFQGALYGLPHDVLKECIVGAIEARFGPLKPVKQEQMNGHAKNGSSVSECKAESITDCCADGIAESTVPVIHAQSQGGRGGDGQFANFEDFIYGVWGRGVAKHFAIPYNRKLWAVPLREMETSWLGGRVPLPDLEEMIDGALRPVARPQGPNARFGYPLRGGFHALMNGFLPHLRGELKLSARVSRVLPSRHLVVLDDGTSISYEKLVSTMPLPRLVAMLGEEAPPRVRKAAEQLRHVSVRCVNLGIGRERLTEKHWIYYPEDTVFHRIFVQGNASPHNNPPGGFGLTCEITYSPHKPLPCEGDALIDRCIADCIKVGIFNEEDAVLVRNQVDMPYAYVIYDHARAENVGLIRHWLRARDIELAGRYSEWEYYNSDHAFLAGKKAAERVEDALTRQRRPPTAREVVAQLLSPAMTSSSAT